MKWRPTTKMPPLSHDPDCDWEESGRLLVHVLGHGIVFGGVRVRPHSIRWYAEGFLGNYVITHWVPLPKPPGADDGKG